LLPEVRGDSLRAFGPLRKTDRMLDFSRFRKPRAFFVVALLATITVAGSYYFASREPVVPPLAFSEFMKAVEAGQVTAVTFGEGTIDVTLRDGRTVATVAPPQFLGANNAFISDLYRRGIRVDVNPLPVPGSLSWSAMATAAAFLALLAFTVYRTTAGRIPSISGRARVAERGDQVTRKACSSSGHREQAKRSSRGRLPAKRGYRSSLRAARISWRCMPASAPPASVACSGTHADTLPASSSSTSSTQWAAAAAATR
jgi:hypothetical protein